MNLSCEDVARYGQITFHADLAVETNQGIDAHDVHESETLLSENICFALMIYEESPVHTDVAERTSTSSKTSRGHHLWNSDSVRVGLS